MLEEGYDCVFGSRFIRGSVVRDYPRVKLVINWVVNWGIRLPFRHGYNDTTNAFKAYRREVIDGVQPLLSNHFNLTVELPLKAFIRGHSFAVVPISWTNRIWGGSKLGLREMGSHLFIVLYAFLEHHLSRGDYHRPDNGSVPNHRAWDCSRLREPLSRALRLSRCSLPELACLFGADGRDRTPGRSSVHVLNGGFYNDDWAHLLSYRYAEPGLGDRRLRLAEFSTRDERRSFLRARRLLA